MLILGIESSCDETGVALYDTDKGLIADALHTQIEMIVCTAVWCLNLPAATTFAALFLCSTR